MFAALKEHYRYLIKRGNEYYPNALKAKEIDTKFTPDIANLEKRLFQPLFVADELMEHRPQNSLMMPQAVNWATAITQDKFTMYCRDLGKDSQVIIVQGHNHSARQIKGLLYLVKPRNLISIDNYKHNGVIFLRKKVRIDLPWRNHRDAEEQIHTLKAWTYIGVPEYWDPIIDNTYSRAKTYHHKGRMAEEYYYYSRMEYTE